MEISSVAPGNIDDQLEQQLLALTLPDGDMAPVYRACKNPVRTDWRGRVFIAWEEGRPVGWALRWQCFRGTKWTLHLYVHPARRRTGIGTELVRAAHRRLRADTWVKGCPWDDTSTAFWDWIEGVAAA